MERIELNQNLNLKLMSLEPKHIIRIAMAYIFKRGRLKYAYQVLRGIELKRGSNKMENETAKQMVCGVCGDCGCGCGGSWLWIVLVIFIVFFAVMNVILFWTKIFKKK